MSKLCARGLREHLDLSKCGDQEGVAVLSGHCGSDLLSALLNIGCEVEGVETKAVPALVLNQNDS